MIKRTRRVADLRRSVLPFSNEETQLIQQKLLEKTGDEALSASLQFSPTAVSGIRQLARNGGVIVCDTQVLANLVRNMLPGELRRQNKSTRPSGNGCFVLFQAGHSRQEPDPGHVPYGHESLPA